MRKDSVSLFWSRQSIERIKRVQMVERVCPSLRLSLPAAMVKMMVDLMRT